MAFNSNHKYSLEEKRKLGSLIAAKKAEFDQQVENAELVFDKKKNKHVRRSPSEGFVSAAIRQHFPSLASVKSSDKVLDKARAFGKRCYEVYKSQEEGLDGEELHANKRFRASGGGRKPIAPEVREAAFQWFLDVRGGLKGRLPRKLFRMKCLEFFAKWKEATNAGAETTFVCSTKWINDWMKEYRVSLNSLQT